MNQVNCSDDLLRQMLGVVRDISKGGRKELRRLIDQDPSLINHTDSLTGNGTWLHEAAMFSRYDLLPDLVQAGLDVNAQNRRGATPLIVAMGRYHEATFKSLLNLGADPLVVNKFGNHALFAAVKHGKMAILTELIFHASDVDVPCGGITSFFLAASCGETAMAGKLLQAGADVDFKRNDGLTALEIAKENSHLDTVEFIYAWIQAQKAQQAIDAVVDHELRPL